MKPIAVFYHCFLFDGSPPKPNRYAIGIVREQMKALKDSGLESAATHICIGVNGGGESKPVSDQIMPAKARVVFHGLTSKNENPTIVEIEKWIPSHHDWHVLYFHAKGSSQRPETSIGLKATRWRACMMDHLVLKWKKCVADLESGMESVGVHWIRGVDKTQNYWAGNFWWATSDYLLTLPSIFKRPAIKLYGLATDKSRYEAEVWIGNGPRLPARFDYHPQHITFAH